MSEIEGVDPGAKKGKKEAKEEIKEEVPEKKDKKKKEKEETLDQLDEEQLALDSEEIGKYYCTIGCYDDNLSLSLPMIDNDYTLASVLQF